MKKNLLLLFTLVVLTITSYGQGPPPATVPFICDGNVFYQNQYKQLYKIDNSVNPFAFITLGAASTYGEYNSLAFNPTDNFLYATLNPVGGTNGNYLLKIDANGNYSRLGPVINFLPNSNNNAGEFDNGGNYYVKASGLNSILYKINLTTLTASTITLDVPLNLHDIAFDITSNK